MRRSRDDSGGWGRGRWRRAIVPGGLGAGLTALATLMLVAQTAAAGAAPSFVLSAPYKSAKAVLTNPVTKAGAGSGAIVAGAFFNRTNGIGGFSDSAAASWNTSFTNNSASYRGQMVLTLGFHVKTSGTHNITVVWLTMADGYLNLTSGKCSGSATNAYTGCTRSASVFVYGTAILQDKTTRKSTKLSVTWPGNSTYISNYTSCYFTSCTSTTKGGSTGTLHTGAAYWSWAWNSVALNSTHNYSLKMTLFGGAAVVLKTMGATLSGASANAQLNSATLGDKEQLVSITVA